MSLDSINTISERLDQILPKITHPTFRENRGLGNEVGFHIFDYEPEFEILVRDHVSFLINRINNDASLNIHIREFDLFEVIIDILSKKGYLEKNFDMEKKRDSTYVLNAMRKALRLTLENDQVIQYIGERVQERDIVFITGVGKVFPILRSHVILNNLHHAVGNLPVVLFFPGRYDGQELILFNEIKDDNYYRAFQLVE